MDKKQREIDKGFTLVELLATVGIIAVVLGIAGYFALSTINESKRESEILAMNNIKKTANIYSEEYPDNIIWKSKDGGNQDACVPVEMLVSKGYLKKKDIENVDLEFVLLEKNEQNAIVKEELDESGICAVRFENEQKVKLPTSKNICEDIVYDGTSKMLLKSNSGYSSNAVSFEGVGTSDDNGAIDAGDYPITVKLGQGYVWSDYSTGDKVVNCKIKKARPTLEFIPNHFLDEVYVGVNKDGIKLSSTVSGDVSFVTSNKDYIVVSKDVKKEIVVPVGQEKVEIPVPIEILSTRKVNTYITATLKPKDSKNYETVKTEFIVGNPKKIGVDKPKCENRVYNGSDQTIVLGEDKGRAYSFSDNIVKTEIGEYDITVKLNYGYKWNDVADEKNATKNYTLTCKIVSPTLTVTYKGGECDPSSKKVTYGKSYGDLCKPKNKSGYKFVGWRDSSNNEVNADTIVSDFRDHTLTAEWISNTYTIKFDSGVAGNVGVTGKTDPVICEYDANCKLRKNGFVRSGLKFTHWVANGKEYTDGAEVKNLIEPGNTIILTAKWRHIELTYVDNYGTNCNGKHKTVIKGKEYGELCVPSRPGYYFLGWFDELYDGKAIKYYADNNTDVRDKHCKELTGNGYDPSCLFGHYRAYGIDEYNKGKKSRKVSQYLSDDIVDKTDDFKLYAGWTTNIWRIGLDKAGGTGGTSEVFFKYNSTSKINGKVCYYFNNIALSECVRDGYYIALPIRNGYKFLGYYTERNGQGTQYVDENGKFINNIYKQYGNKTLYAHWKKISTCPDGQHEFLIYGTKIRKVRWGYVIDEHYPDPPGHGEAHVVYCKKCGMSAINYNRNHGGFSVTHIADIVCPYCSPGSPGHNNTCVGELVLNHGKQAIAVIDDSSLTDGEVGIAAS